MGRLRNATTSMPTTLRSALARRIFSSPYNHHRQHRFLTLPHNRKASMFIKTASLFFFFWLLFCQLGGLRRCSDFLVASKPLAAQISITGISIVYKFKSALYNTLLKSWQLFILLEDRITAHPLAAIMQKIIAGLATARRCCTGGMN